MKKNGYGVNVKETTSHLQSFRSIKYTSRGCHTIFNKWEISSMQQALNCPNKNKVDKSVDTILYQFIRYGKETKIV